MDDFVLPELEVSEPFVIQEDWYPFGTDRQNPLVTGYIGHDEIASLPVRNIADVLAFLPGVDVRSRGTSGMQTDISLTGGTFDQILVLLNGIPINDAQTGHYAMNLPLSPELIERIEVRQGNAACRIGALTGAINIITRDSWNGSSDRKNNCSAAMAAGMNGEIAPSFTGSWQRGRTRINTSAEYARSNGYYAPAADDKERAALENTDCQTANIYLQTRWHDRNMRHRLDVQAGAQYKDAGLGTGYGFASIDQFDATRTLSASVRYEHTCGTNWTLSAQAAYRANYDRYEWHRGTVTNRHWTHNAHAAFRAHHYHSQAGHTTLEAEFRNEYIRSTNMGEHSRLQASLSAEHVYAYEGFSASMAAAGHYHSLFGWYGSGYANIGYRGKGSVFLTASRSLRTPTWTDLYYKAGVQLGSTDLKAEKAWTLALNGKYHWTWEQAGSLHAEGNIYYRWGEDIIDWTFDSSDSLFHATNRNKVNTFGIEVSASYRLNSWLRNVSVSYAYTDLSLDVAKAQSNYLDYLRHKIVASIDHGIYVWEKGAVGANWTLRWQDREGAYVDIHGTPGNAFAPVLLLDACLYADLARVRVSLVCTNMTNRHYYDYGGILMPGTQARIRLKCTF